MDHETEALAAQVVSGNRRALSRAITLVESTRDDHRQKAAQLLQALTPRAGNSLRIGISGVPGAGKSTFIEAMGNLVLDRGHRLAVLAVDPSSSLSGGSILGDKTRMELLSRRREAFIRPSPTAGNLGGVARRTRESMLLCEAAGFDVIFVETVGVGQSETAVAEMTDLFLLLLLPGGGDDLQGIKRGIMELADMVLINKADGDLATAARHSAADYRSALTLIHPRTHGWRVPVLTCSALCGDGIGEVWEKIGEYRTTVTESGDFEKRRATQAKSWMWTEISEGLLAAFRQEAAVRARMEQVETEVRAGRLPPTLAAAELLGLFYNESADAKKTVKGANR
jgi:LAO/AO transport system kinase